MSGRVVLRSVPRRSTALLIVVGTAVVVVVVVDMVRTRSWDTVLVLLLGAVNVVQGVLHRRARVLLDEAGLTSHGGGPRRQRVAWREVRAVVLDPPGGPRHLHLVCLDGRTVTLPELSERDTAVVQVRAAGGPDHRP